MEVSYPLLGKTVRFEMELLRRDKRWYPADAVRKAERSWRGRCAAPAGGA
jgi:hypothetical protein